MSPSNHGGLTPSTNRLGFGRQRRIVPSFRCVDLPLPLGKLRQLLFNQRVDRSRWKLTCGIACPGSNIGQHLDALVDGLHCVDVKLFLCHCLDDIGAQHQIAQVRRRHEHALLSGQAFYPAEIVKTFDLTIDAADRLNFSVLIN